MPKLHVRRILVCLDLSPFSEVCLPYAIAIAQTFGSELTLTHVMQPPREHPGPHTTDALGWEIARQEARAYLERHEQEAARALGRAVEIRLEQGHPAERIVGLARELRADLTVLGSHGEGGVTQWNLGSTVQQVLAVTRGSVLIAHSASSPPNVAIPKRILVPLDGSLRTESVLPTVARIASTFGAELLLVHVVQEPLASSVLCDDEDLDLAKQLATRLEFRAERYLAGIRDRLLHEVPSVCTLVVRHPNERQSLLEISKQEHVDLVVLSAHGIACDPARSFGSVTAHLLTHSVVPLLVLQDLPRELEQPHDLGENLAPPLRASFPPEAV
ncbi:MAG TPA: universal stress protein [Kofleriaceae bacterium]|nr:universal stress protein [Kofleriaceae bacterium]